MNAFLKWFGIAVAFLVAVIIILLALQVVLPASMQLGQEVILAIAGAALSLLFSYWPGVRVEFAALAASTKALVNVLAVVLVAVIMYGLGCTGLFTLAGLVCSTDGLKTLLTYVAIAIVINQTFDYFSVDAPDVAKLKTGTTPPVG